MTDFFSPHWLTFLYESSTEFVTCFSWIEFLIVYLILWSLTHFVSRTPIFSKLSCLIVFSPVLKSCLVWGIALIFFFLASLLCFKYLLEFVFCLVVSPFFLTDSVCESSCSVVFTWVNVGRADCSSNYDDTTAVPVSAQKTLSLTGFPTVRWEWVLSWRACSLLLGFLLCFVFRVKAFSVNEWGNLGLALWKAVKHYCLQVQRRID